MASMNNGSSFDSLLLQSLMGRLQLRPPYLNSNSFLSHSLDDFLLPGDDDAADDDPISGDSPSDRSPLAREESKLEKEIVRLILSGRADSLKPNSGQAVSIGDHHICVGSHDEDASGYRVWEWHGHIMLFDEERGYSPEYIYGNYFERVQPKESAAVSGGGGRKKDEEKEGSGGGGRKKDEEKEGGGVTQGLRELIGGAGSANGRILQRNLNTGSPR